ncbi:MAG TPA: cupin domain-containing protein [Dehalococcoidia bacterium]|jgi:uncharacterized RmlC-like cupin family protein|nr:cupin domain-containing protein [Dehalococcoidia bacterium]
MTTEPHARCLVISPGRTYEAKHGLQYTTGIFAENAGARGLSMQLLTIPPGGRGKAHLHAGHETAIYLIRGRVVTLFGEGLREQALASSGDFVYIPAGVQHVPVNVGDEEAIAVHARTDPNIDESVVLLPDLDAVVDAALQAIGND